VAGDLLDRILREIRQRKREARAAYDESRQLEQALAALGEDAGAVAPRRAKRRRAERPPAQPSRRAPRGANREAILAAVRERPGSTAGEIADATGIARATVASTTTRLAASGVLERSERPDTGVGFHVA
jgi:CRP-like cAMP-binding protein